MDRVVGSRKGSLTAPVLAALCLLGITTAPVSAQTAPRYSVTDLAGVGQQINNNGQVAGWITVGASAHAAIYSNGAWRDLGVPAGDQLSTLFGINSAGAVVGYSFGFPPPTNRWTAIWAPAGANSVQALVAPDSFAYAINDSGAIVGCRNENPDTSPDPNRAFLFANGTLTELHGLLTPLPDAFTCAHDINTAGVVVGEFNSSGQNRGFLYRNGAATLVQGGSSYLSIARAINTAGKVVGDGRLSGSGADQALTYNSTNSTFASVGVESTGATASNGNDINTRGDVVGKMQLNVGQHAFLASGGAVYDLNDLIPAGSGWVLQEALSINDSGQIVGSGVLSSDPGNQRYFLLDASAAAPSIAGLIAKVKALEAGRFLSHGNATSLIAHLENADRHLRGRCSRLAVQQLEIFVDQVDTLIRTGRLSPTKGQPLIDEANRIIASLTSSTSHPPVKCKVVKVPKRYRR